MCGPTVRMYKRRDYVDLYEKDQAKWALVRNVNTVFKHSTLLPVGLQNCVCVCACVGLCLYCEWIAGHLVELSEELGQCCNWFTI